MYKRKRNCCQDHYQRKKPRKEVRNRETDMSEEFIQSCEEKFKSDKSNIIARNAVASVGSQFATTNSTRVNELTYVFLNTVKKHHIKATNQGNSGRCWMFAALNTFRHAMIKTLNLENFEFSETYLFFWDKFERCNSYIRWFIDHPEEDSDSRAFEYMITHYMGDGGWWNTFANLVNKYGLLPKECMQETATSGWSDEMNQILKEHIDSCVNLIINNRDKYTAEQLLNIKDECMQNIYSILVKFLGEPPKKFTWSFVNNEGDGSIIGKISPQEFADIVAPDVDMLNDFVVLCNVPTRDFAFDSCYRIKYTNNVYEGECCTLYNVHIDELAKYAMKSIEAGLAVWFGADVTQSFNMFHSALDDELDDHKIVFGQIENFDKGDRIMLRNVQGNHAMALTGFNIDANGQILNWQVENSWGFYDNETLGMDGFLTMSHSWFKKYVIEITVHKNFLSRTMRKKISKHPIDSEPWDSMAPATRVGVVNPPKNYQQILASRRKDTN